MSERTTSAEICEALFGSVTKALVRKTYRKLKKANWPYIESQTRGGHRRCYALSILDETTRLAVLQLRGRSAAQSVLNQAAKDSTVAILEDDEQRAVAAREQQERRVADGRRQFSALPKDSHQRLRAKAREWLLQAYWNMHKARGGTRDHSRFEFTGQVNRGEIDVPANVLKWIPQYNGQHSLTTATLQRWEGQHRKCGRWGLTGGYGTRKGHSKIESNPELFKMVLGAMIKYPHS